MNCIFAESLIFDKFREHYLTDSDYRLLQNELLVNPKLGDVIKGTGGLRKVRVGAKGKGKRGGCRIIYFYLEAMNRFYLLTLYAKNEMTDLTSAQKKQLKHFVEDWINEQA